MKKRKVIAAIDTDTTSGRYAELKKILEDRRREILSEVQSRIKDVRAEGASGITTEMKAETLQRINEALDRLDEGTYGRCFECGDEISEARLRALPFAVRCKDCEEAREVAANRERLLSRRAPTFFADVQGS
jgi:DnaK suppressor protein